MDPRQYVFTSESVSLRDIQTRSALTSPIRFWMPTWQRIHTPTSPAKCYARDRMSS